jgi:DNA-binding PadR family transcriptional regulator
VYPALYRLEGAGLLSSSWTAASGRRRRIYRVTALGRRRLARYRNEWNEFSGAVEAVVS